MQRAAGAFAGFVAGICLAMVAGILLIAVNGRDPPLIGIEQGMYLFAPTFALAGTLAGAGVKYWWLIGAVVAPFLMCGGFLMLLGIGLAGQ